MQWAKFVGVEVFPQKRALFVFVWRMGTCVDTCQRSWACAFHFSGVLKVDLRRHETMQWLNQSGIPSCVVFPECAIRYKSLVAKLLCIALNGWPLVVSMFDVILLMLCFFDSELQSNTIHPTKWNSIHMALWQYWKMQPVQWRELFSPQGAHWWTTGAVTARFGEQWTLTLWTVAWIKQIV